MSPIISLGGSILNTILQGSGSKNTTADTTAAASSLGPQPDKAQLSPFAQLMSTLQQLQQTDPARFQQLTQKIAANLQSAAQAAEAQGNTAAANQLNQLASDFTNASKSGQFPNIQDLAQAMGAHGHHHHRHSPSSSSGAESTNPMNIIGNTLSSAGIGTSTT